MRFYLPCKLGEKFTSLKFAGWVDGERTYLNDRECMLKGFDKSLFDMVCIAVDNSGTIKLLNYGEYGKHYEACYELYIDDKYFEWEKLSEWGFPSERTGKLIGLSLEEGYEVAHFCMQPRYEHINFAIKDLVYNNTAVDDVLMFDAVKNAQIEQIKKEKVQKVPHCEELTLSEEEKSAIIRCVINRAKEINLKLRKSDIDKKEIYVRRTIFGDKKYYCMVDADTLGSRMRRIPKKLDDEDLIIKNKKMMFIFENMC